MKGPKPPISCWSQIQVQCALITSQKQSGYMQMCYINET